MRGGEDLGRSFEKGVLEVWGRGLGGFGCLRFRVYFGELWLRVLEGLDGWGSIDDLACTCCIGR